MRTSALFAIALVAACATGTKTPPTPAVDEQETEMTESAEPKLLEEWSGPHGGVPPLDQVEVADFQPALEKGMKDALAEFHFIGSNPEPATFDNTLLAMEKAGQGLGRVLPLYYHWTGSFSSDEMRAVQKEMSPKLAAHSDRIMQDEKLFTRVKAVYEKREELGEEEARLAKVYYDRFVRAGAALDADAKARVAEINQALSKLYTQFSNNLLADEEKYVLYLTSEEELAGLSDSYKAAASAAAEKLGHPGEWAVTNTRSSMEPFLQMSERRDLREKVWTTYYSRGDNGDENDNNALIPQILKLRAERAKLLGFETHAHFRTHYGMAKSPEATMDLMESVWKASTARVKQEVADMQAVADKEKAGITIEPWDYRFYAEKVRKAKYDLDQNEVKQYLQLDKLREGMFWAVSENYGWTFTEVDLPVPSEDVRVWEVTAADGLHQGLFYFDPYARTGKRSGAWMSSYRDQDGLGPEGHTPIIHNNANFVKGAPGEPVLISWDDAETLFHEFGHAIHGLSSNVIYPSLAGTAVARDFVEFPSQLNERWLATNEVLSKFALHVETGEPMPKELLERIEAASTFNQGFGTTEYLASALIDMKLHLAGDAEIDPDAFEREELEKLGMPSELVMRHRTPQFGHVFSGDGYSAGYYSYLWADALTSDAAEAFTDGEGYYDRDVANAYMEHVLSAGNRMDAADAWMAFRGREVDTAALMRARGFPVTQ